MNQRLADTRQALAEDQRDVMEQNRKAAQGAGDARRERQQAEHGGRNHSPTEVALPVAVPASQDSRGDDRRQRIRCLDVKPQSGP